MTAFALALGVGVLAGCARRGPRRAVRPDSEAPARSARAAGGLPPAGRRDRVGARDVRHARRGDPRDRNRIGPVRARRRGAAVPLDPAAPRASSRCLGEPGPRRPQRPGVGVRPTRARRAQLVLQRDGDEPRAAVRRTQATRRLGEPRSAHSAGVAAGHGRGARGRSSRAPRVPAGDPRAAGDTLAADRRSLRAREDRRRRPDPRRARRAARRPGLDLPALARRRSAGSQRPPRGAARPVRSCRSHRAGQGRARAPQPADERPPAHAERRCGLGRRPAQLRPRRRRRRGHGGRAGAGRGAADVRAVLARRRLARAGERRRRARPGDRPGARARSRRHDLGREPRRRRRARRLHAAAGEDARRSRCRAARSRDRGRAAPCARRRRRCGLPAGACGAPGARPRGARGAAAGS